MKTLRITVSGPPLSFKSTVSELISRALAQAGIPHTVEVEETVKSINFYDRLKALRNNEHTKVVVEQRIHSSKDDSGPGSPVPGSTTFQVL